MNLRKFALCFGILALVQSKSYSGGISAIQLEVTGIVYGPPSLSVLGMSTSSINYNFVSTRRGTLTSKPVVIRLNNSFAIKGDSISVNPPLKCRKGKQSIANSNVSFVINGKSETQPKLFEFTRKAGAVTAVEIKNADGDGEVSCAQPGIIAYSF